MFDIAGTTVYDPDGVGRCLKSALSAAGVPFTHERVNGMMGIPKPVVIQTLLDEAGTTGNVGAIHDDFRARMLEYYAHDPEVREISGARTAFDRLRARGTKVALDTGFDRPIVEAILDRLGWRGAVDLTVASDEVPKGRPEPDLVFRAMAELGVENADEVAKIGDTPADLEEGTAAGCGLVIGVTYGTHTREQLEDYPHTHLADSMDEAVEMIASDC